MLQRLTKNYDYFYWNCSCFNMSMPSRSMPTISNQLENESFKHLLNHFIIKFSSLYSSIHVTQTPFSISQIGKIYKTAKLKKIKKLSFTNWLASDLHRIFRRFLRLFDHLRFQLDEQTNQKISSKMKTMRVTKIWSQSKIISTILGELLSSKINFLFPCKLESNNNFACISLTNERTIDRCVLKIFGVRAEAQQRLFIIDFANTFFLFFRDLN
jgi:hypothetical protein